MLSNKYFSAVIINAVFIKVLLTFPKLVVENSGNAAWIQIIYNTAVAMLFFTAVMKIYNRKKNIIEVAEINYGKTVKIITGIIVFVILGINFIPIIRIFPETVKTVLLQDTETSAIVGITAVAAAVGAYFGIESIARIIRIFLPVVAIVLIAFIVMLIPKYSICNITPIFGNGYKSIFITGFNSLSLFSDLIILNLLIPYTKNLDAVRKYGRWSILIAGGAATVLTVVYCLVFSYPASKNYIIPVYQMARLINLTSFFSRFEALFEFIWSIMILLYVSLYIYMMCYTVQITFSLKFLKPIIYPVTLIMFIISLLPDSIMDMMKINNVVVSFSYIPVFALMLIFGRVRKKKC